MNVTANSIKNLLIGFVICSAVFYRFSLFGINVLNLSFVASALILIITILQHRISLVITDSVLAKRAAILIFIYISFGLISSIWSKSSTEYGWMNTIKVFSIVFILMLCIGDTIDFRLLNIGWIISGVIVFYMLFTHGDYYLGGIRYSIVMSDFFIDTNVLFPVFIVPAVLILVKIFDDRNSNVLVTVGSVAYLAVLGYYLMMSGSRGAMLAVISSMAMCVFFSKKSWKWVLLILICFIGMFFIIQNFISTDLLARFTAENLRETGGSGRVEIWENAIHYFSKETGVFAFLFGSGINSAKIDLGLTTHNMFIECLIEYGVVGIINFVIVYIFLFISSIKQKNVIGISVLTGTVIWGMTVAINIFLLYWMLLFYVLLVLLYNYGPAWFQYKNDSIKRVEE